MNSLCNSNSVIDSMIAHFLAKYCINFTSKLLHQHVLQLCQVFVLLCLLKTKKLVLTISVPASRSDLSFIEGFNLAEITEMIDYVSTSKTLH